MSTEIQLNGQRYSAFAISRKLSSAAIDSLTFKDDLPDAFPNYGIEPKYHKALAVTLVERGEVQRAREIHKDICHRAAKDLIPKILKPEPGSATAGLELRVTDVCYLGHRMAIRCLALMLDDSEGFLQAERELYTKRLSTKNHWKQLEPHITIAKLEPINTIGDILDWVEQRYPESICVEPVSISEIALHHKHALVR
jgi:hypothetical protein